MKKLLKAKRLILTLASLAAAAIALTLIASWAVVYSTRDMIVTPDEAKKLDADCILVLGAKVYDTRPSLMLADRLDTGIALYNAGISNRLLMSGDHSTSTYNEVGAMLAYAEENGVVSSDVFLDHEGYSTYESITRLQEYFGVKKVIIVSQEYHLYRAVYSARALGLDAYGVSADYRDYAGQFYREGREILARVKDFFFVKFDVQPTFLGDVIPVSGDGNATLG